MLHFLEGGYFPLLPAKKNDSYITTGSWRPIRSLWWLRALVLSMRVDRYIVCIVIGGNGTYRYDRVYCYLSQEKKLSSQVLAVRLYV